MDEFLKIRVKYSKEVFAKAQSLALSITEQDGHYLAHGHVVKDGKCDCKAAAVGLSCYHVAAVELYELQRDLTELQNAVESVKPLNENGNQF